MKLCYDNNLISVIIFFQLLSADGNGISRKSLTAMFFCKELGGFSESIKMIVKNSGVTTTHWSMTSSTMSSSTMSSSSSSSTTTKTTKKVVTYSYVEEEFSEEEE